MTGFPFRTVTFFSWAVFVGGIIGIKNFIILFAMFLLSFSSQFGWAGEHSLRSGVGGDGGSILSASLPPCVGVRVHVPYPLG